MAKRSFRSRCHYFDRGYGTWSENDGGSYVRADSLCENAVSGMFDNNDLEDYISAYMPHVLFDLRAHH